MVEECDMATEDQAEALFKRGIQLINGDDMRQNFAEAAKCFRLAADHGSAEAQGCLGMLYMNGTGVKQDYTNALKWLRLAVEGGNHAAYHGLGNLYLEGHGVRKDETEAARCYRIAADCGFDESQLYLGILCAEGKGVPKDPVQAFMWFSLASTTLPNAAKMRDALRLSITPEQHAEGEQLTHDWLSGSITGISLAKTRISETAMKNNGTAENTTTNDQADELCKYAVQYASGDGASRDQAEAVRYFRMAADKGSLEALVNLGAAYQHGNGVPVNYAEAMKYFSAAAHAGVYSAYHNMGNMYLEGHDDIQQDYSEAARCYRQAADKGHDDSQYGMGVLCAAGKGVPRDPVQAFMWYNLAGATQPKAAKERDALRRSLTPEQLAEGEQLTHDWRSRSITGESLAQTRAQAIVIKSRNAVQSAEVVLPAATYDESPAYADTRCPRCNSDDTQAVRMLVAEGTHSGNLELLGVDTDGTITVSGGSVGLQSNLAQRLDSGSRPSFFGPIFLACVCVIMPTFINWLFTQADVDITNGLFAFGVVGVGVALIWAATVPERIKEWEKKKALHDNAWVCKRCGAIWMP